MSTLQNAAQAFAKSPSGKNLETIINLMDDGHAFAFAIVKGHRRLAMIDAEALQNNPLSAMVDSLPEAERLPLATQMMAEKCFKEEDLSQFQAIHFVNWVFNFSRYATASEGRTMGLVVVKKDGQVSITKGFAK